MKKFRRNKKGFTLIELIVVVAILAILAAVAVPNFIGMTNKAQTSTEVAAAAEIANAINIYNTLNPNSMITAVDADAITTLDELAPTLDASISTPATYVYPRITITSGVASVTNKDDIA